MDIDLCWNVELIVELLRKIYTYKVVKEKVDTYFVTLTDFLP